MGQGLVPWTRPLELAIGAVGHLLAREKNEAEGTWWAWVSQMQETGGRHVHQVVQARAASLGPLEPPEAFQHAPPGARP
jgi:hypothetical protein